MILRGVVILYKDGPLGWQGVDELYCGNTCCKITWNMLVQFITIRHLKTMTKAVHPWQDSRRLEESFQQAMTIH
jgi:hypothetical protein